MPTRIAPLHPPLHPKVSEVTARVRERSAHSRAEYLGRVDAAAAEGTTREGMSCTNLAHGFAAAQPVDKDLLRRLRAPNVAIVSSYNDMLSAHQPFERFPALIKQAAREAGAVAQFAGGVPAMCDGVTQGYAGHGAVAVQPRRDRDVDGGRARAQHVRRGALPRCLRQDRPRAPDGRAGVRPSAGGLRARRPDALGHPEQGEGAHPPALRRGQAGARRAARVGGAELPRAGHMHVLRHGEQQPDADGGHGPAPARRGVRVAQYAAARRADAGGGAARGGDHLARPRATCRSRASSTSGRS